MGLQNLGKCVVSVAPEVAHAQDLSAKKIGKSGVRSPAKASTMERSNNANPQLYQPIL
jgi:hypothetical protein